MKTNFGKFPMGVAWKEAAGEAAQSGSVPHSQRCIMWSGCHLWGGARVSSVGTAETLEVSQKVLTGSGVMVSPAEALPGLH